MYIQNSNVELQIAKFTFSTLTKVKNYFFRNVIWLNVCFPAIKQFFRQTVNENFNIITLVFID